MPNLAKVTVSVVLVHIFENFSVVWSVAMKLVVFVFNFNETTIRSDMEVNAPNGGNVQLFPLTVVLSRFCAI
ncbi:Scytalone dehydratase-like protein [Trichinella pseudospiralis]